MQICYNCGKEVADEVLICPDCGALVRRYTTPAQSAGYDEPQARSAACDAPEAAAQSAASGPVWRDAGGRLHFRGIVTGWLVICLIAAVYQCFSYAMVFVSYHNRQTLVETLQMGAEEVPQFEQLIALFHEMMAVVGEFYAVFVLLLAVSVALLGTCVWLLAAKKRAAVFAFVAAAALMAVLQLVFGTGSVLFAAAMAGVTLALLRRSLPIMK